MSPTRTPNDTFESSGAVIDVQKIRDAKLKIEQEAL
jgi:hypothetical protein